MSAFDYMQDDLLSVRAKATQLQYPTVAGQMNALVVLREFLSAWGRVKALLADDATDITNDQATAVTLLRRTYQAMKKMFTDESTMHPDLAFKASESQTELVATFVQACKYDFAVMNSSAGNDLNSVKEKFTVMVNNCVRGLKESSVEGWEAKKDDLANDIDLAAALVNNPKYGQLHEQNEMLNKILPKIKQVARDGVDHMFSTEFLETAESVERHAALTVLHTYVIMQLLDAIPALKSPAAGQKAVNLLRDEVGVKMFDGKRSPLGASLIERSKKLAAGAEFERIDFLATAADTGSTTDTKQVAEVVPQFQVVDKAFG